MKIHSLKCVATVALVLALPLAAQAQMHDCNMQGMDMSKMSAEEKQKLHADCAAKMQHKDCGMKDMDMSKMSAQDKQNMMAQCHDKTAPDATTPPSVPATPAIPATPAAPAAHNHNGGS